MMQARVSGATSFSRRRFVQAAAAAAGGVAGALAWPQRGVAGGGGDTEAVVAPKPIPGGIVLPEGQQIHVWAPGDPGVTLPFTGITLMGLDVEPATITDFRGFSAVAFHVGTAVGGDGATYNLETDVRAFEGSYAEADGTRRTGSFAFIWVDLFEPGSGSQVHDFNGGILPSGLFWTLAVDDDALRVSSDARGAVLEVEDLEVIDSFSFGSPLATPARLTMRVEWHATGPPRARGRSSAVPATDAAAFRGELAVAASTATFKGSELGFSFESNPGVSTQRGFAELGRERNGSFL